MFCVALVLAATGCRTVKVSEPSRTVGEQLLLSTAVDRAVADADLSPLRGKKVYVEEKYFDSYDEGYALGAVRQRIAESGALLVSSETNADIIVEARSGGIGLDTAETLIGIPEMGVPIPLTGAVKTPELALYKKNRADSLAKLALFARERDSGSHVYSSGSMAGKAYMNRYKILFVGWRMTDVPEFKLKKQSPAQP